MNLARTWAVARKEWIHIRRDTRSLALAFGLPLFLLVFFGYAIQFDVEDIRMAVLDHSNSQESRRLVEAFQASNLFLITEQLTQDREAADRLLRGTATAVLQIPPDFAARTVRGDAQVQLLLDGSDANTATIALSYADVLVAAFASEIQGV
ncbi:MAG: ABC transporter permease, partial [Gemmatimonadota bacterium]|nr:ABC transporter permease [Gemmatimonadota bacterium]